MAGWFQHLPATWFVYRPRSCVWLTALCNCMWGEKKVKPDVQSFLFFIRYICKLLRMTHNHSLSHTSFSTSICNLYRFPLAFIKQNKWVYFALTFRQYKVTELWLILFQQFSVTVFWDGSTSSTYGHLLWHEREHILCSSSVPEWNKRICHSWCAVVYHKLLPLLYFKLMATVAIGWLHSPAFTQPAFPTLYISLVVRLT